MSADSCGPRRNMATVGLPEKIRLDALASPVGPLSTLAQLVVLCPAGSSPVKVFLEGDS